MFDDHTRRNSLRYSGYDYARSGAVFVTICTQGRQRLFGCVQKGGVVLSLAGEKAADRWRQIPGRFPDVLTDAFIVTPDHVHGILFTATDPSLDQPATAGAVVRWFKSTMFTDYTTGVAKSGWEPYDRQLWQRNYYDRIIRNDRELNLTRQYIDANPARWQERVEQETRL